MKTLPFPGYARVASLGAALGLLLISSNLHAQQSGFPAIPDAPTVPVAPTLPDAAIVNQPLQPAASQEIIEERPSSQHVWVAGHWKWQEGRYAWIAGRWEVPPRPNLDWMEPRWEKRGNGYILAGGYWWDDGIPNNSGAPSPTPVATVQGTPVAQPSSPPPLQPNTISLPDAPPPPQREYIVEQPSPYHVWVSGYWGFRGGRRVWVGGHWDLPPRTNVVWVEPRWERRGNVYVFVDGYWRDATPVRYVPPPPPGPGPSLEIVIGREPPPPRREVIPARPPPGMIWVGGYWSWHGDRHIWVAGHFERPPRPQAVWVQPRWERRGGGYIFIQGSWR